MARRAPYPDGAAESTAYSIAAAPSGALLFRASHTDPNAKVRETFTDLVGRTRVYVEHPSPTTSSNNAYDYLASGELSSITDADNHTTTLGYDLRGKRTTMNSPDAGKLSWSYDLMGNLSGSVDPNLDSIAGQVTYHYNRDRLTSITYPSKPAVTFTYDHSRVTEVDDESGSEVRTYGSLGELRRTLRTISTAGGDTFVFDATFETDSLGRQLQVVYPDGTTVKNAYDAGGALSSVTGSGAGWSHTFADQIQYDVFGNRTHLRYGNNVVSTWSYEPARVRLSSVTTTLPTTDKIQDLHYTYDPGSNPTQIQNNLAALTSTSGKRPGASTVTLTYDGVDRLTHAVGTAALDATTTSNYDETFSFTASHAIASRRARTSSSSARRPRRSPRRASRQRTRTA